MVQHAHCPTVRVTGRGIGAALSSQPVATTPGASVPNEIDADQLQHLFDALPDVVFFVKDLAGRYTHVNLTLAQRLGRRRRAEVIGRHPSELFSAALGNAYIEQDRRVLSGERIDNCLELQLFPNRIPGWCLTRKEPLYVDGRICGMVGISRDLGQRESECQSFIRLSMVLDYFKANFGETVRLSEMAKLAGLSVSQLARLVRRVFHLTPQQLLTKYRIDAAMHMLSSKDSIAAIGQACGFSDQSALSRQFKAMVGMSPSAYRILVSRGSNADARLSNRGADSSSRSPVAHGPLEAIGRPASFCAGKRSALHTLA